VTITRRYKQKGSAHRIARTSSPKTAFIQLGRFGDILNILPAVEHFANNDSRPTLVVAEAYKSIAESIAYADVLALPVDFSQWSTAKAQAQIQGKFSRIISSQVYGHGVTGNRSTDSFCLDSFKQAGYLKQYEEGFLDSILIDKRNEEAEAKLLESFPSETPLVLINTQGTSSPFKNSAELLADVHAAVGEHATIVDLSTVRAERFTDLLGLYDRATLLVTTDTGTLHLAGASTVPYIALVTDSPTPWHGALCRGNCLLRVRYSNFEKWREIIKSVARGAVADKPRPRYLHVYQAWAGKGEARARNKLASLTHRMNYTTGAWRPLPISDASLPRLFQDKGRTLPYVNDLIEYGFQNLQNLQQGERLVYSNTDSCFVPNLASRLDTHKGLVVCRRRDFPKLVDPLTVDEAAKGHSYVGKDVFVITREWWEKRKRDFPPMVQGAEGWDAVLCELLRKDGATVTTDDIYHQRHSSEWERPENRYDRLMQKYCLRVGGSALEKMGLNPADFGFKL